MIVFGYVLLFVCYLFLLHYSFFCLLALISVCLISDPPLMCASPHSFTHTEKSSKKSTSSSVTLDVACRHMGFSLG